MEDEPLFLILPAAGLGKRMRSVNPHIPKEMLPVGNKPAIQYAVEEGLSADIKNIIIILNNQKEVIRQYFENRRFRKGLFPLAFEDMEEVGKRCTITFLYQKEPLGEADAIGLAEEVVGNSTSAILYPDNIYFPAPGALKVLKAAFIKYRKDTAALMEVTDENASGLGNSGRVDLSPLEADTFRIERFCPKSEGHFLIRFKGELRTCGISISGPHIFNYITRARNLVKEGEFTDVLFRNLILKEKGMLGCLLPGTVFDVGNPKGYELCISYIKKKFQTYKV